MPNASVKPVTMMMITARILATEAFDRLQDLIERLLQGMFEPAAQAETETSI